MCKDKILQGLGPLRVRPGPKPGLLTVLTFVWSRPRPICFDDLGSVGRNDKLKGMSHILMISRKRRISLYGRQKREVSSWTHIEKVRVMYRKTCIINRK